MNSGNLPLITTQLDCNSTVTHVTTSLRSAGFLVQKSFDLDAARIGQNECNCNPDTCTCRLVILLVYALQGPPATLIIDSDDSNTVVYLETIMDQSIHSGWIGNLGKILTASVISDIPATGQGNG